MTRRVQDKSSMPSTATHSLQLVECVKSSGIERLHGATLIREVENGI